MTDIDVDSIMSAMSSPEAGKNITGLMDLVDEANKFLGKLDKTMSLLDRMGVKPLIVRAAGVKLGVDVDTPLQAEKGLKPRTEAHAQIYERLNAMSEEELTTMFTPAGIDTDGNESKPSRSN